jgi:hypothetical protein
MFGSKPPAAPTVIIDTSLGIPPEATGFNFDKFYDLARTVGYTDDEISTHIQHFSGRSPRSLAGRHRGRTATTFIPSALKLAEEVTQKGPEFVTKKFGVDILKNPTPESVVNQTAIHEFGHDHDNLHLNGKRDTRVHIVRQILPRLAVLGCGVEMIVEMNTTEQITQMLVSFGAMVVASGVALLQGQGPQINHGTEGVAYRFQEQYGEIPIVNFDPGLLGRLSNS